MCTSLPVVTPYAALLSLCYIGLSVNVIRLRKTTSVGLGTGASDTLLRATRAHANFAEYVPLALLLLWLLETAGYGFTTISALAGFLVMGRVTHAYSLLIGEHQGIILYRQLGMMLTFGVMGLSALLLLAASL